MSSSQLARLIKGFFDETVRTSLAGLLLAGPAANSRRLISLTTLVVAIVKSSQLSGVVMSALSDAQGWRSQQQGKEPQL